MSASVIEYISFGSFSSIGLYAVLLVTSLHFQLPLTTSSWNKMQGKGYENIFQEPVLWHRLSTFFQNCVTCLSIPTDLGSILKTKLEYYSKYGI